MTEGLIREFSSKSRAGLTDDQLRQEYKRIASNDVYDSLERSRCGTRWAMIDAATGARRIWHREGAI